MLEIPLISRSSEGDVPPRHVSADIDNAKSTFKAKTRRYSTVQTAGSLSQKESAESVRMLGGSKIIVGYN